MDLRNSDSSKTVCIASGDSYAYAHIRRLYTLQKPPERINHLSSFIREVVFRKKGAIAISKRRKTYVSLGF